MGHVTLRMPAPVRSSLPFSATTGMCLGMSGQMMVGSSSMLSTSDMAFSSCFVRVESLLQMVGRRAVRIRAAMWYRISAQGGRFELPISLQPSMRRGQHGSFQSPLFGKKPQVFSRMRRPGQAGLSVAALSSLSSSTLFGNTR
jgi:hypothetical protein